MAWDGLHNIHCCREWCRVSKGAGRTPHWDRLSTFRLLFQRSLQNYTVEGHRIGGQTGNQLMSRQVQEEGRTGAEKERGPGVRLSDFQGPPRSLQQTQSLEQSILSFESLRNCHWGQGRWMGYIEDSREPYPLLSGVLKSTAKLWIYRTTQMARSQLKQFPSLCLKVSLRSLI